MNKLEEYRENYFKNLVKEAFGEEPPKKLFDKEKSLLYDFLKEGFDAAIALDLPIKFHKWYIGEVQKAILENKFYEKPYCGFNDEKLYQYWIDNIYKPE